jgi:lipid-A-disaccharide synthase
MVVMGRAHPLTALILSWGLRSAWLSMPNLIAQAEIVPERMQADATADRIAAALAPLFEGPAREEQIEALARARARLGPPGAAERVAAIAEEMLGTLGA